MRAWFGPDEGLDAAAAQVFRGLSEQSRSLLASEMDHPESLDTIRWILAQRDPEAAVADVVAENVRRATEDASGGGLNGGLGKSFFKRLRKLHSRIVHAVTKTTKRVHQMVGKIDPGQRMLFGKPKRHSGGVPIAVAAASSSSGGDAMQVPDPSLAPYTPTSTVSSGYATNPPVNYVQEQPPASDPGAATPQDPSAAAPPPTVPTAAPAATTASATTPSGEQVNETAGLPTASGYTVTVEGQTITNYPVDIATLASVIQSGTQFGDRFEILADGTGTGLRIRTANGFISIPDAQRAQVMAMTHDQVVAMLQQAAQAAAQGPATASAPAAAAPTPDTSAAPSTGGAMPWLLGGGAALLALMRTGGKRGRR